VHGLLHRLLHRRWGTECIGAVGSEAVEDQESRRRESERGESAAD
jgi:hypothetical protein